MKSRSISGNLQMRVRRFVENEHEEEIFGIQRGENLINSLSTFLRNEVLSDAYLKHINQIPILKKHFGSEFLKELSLIFKEFTVAQEEFIYKVFEFNKIIFNNY